MPCEKRGFSKRSAVKGTVSLVNALQERSTSEGFLLESKPLIESASSLSAVTNAAGNYKFDDLADSDYVLRLQSEGFEPYTTTLHTPVSPSNSSNPATARGILEVVSLFRSQK